MSKKSVSKSRSPVSKVRAAKVVPVVRSRRTFTEEFRREAVAMVLDGHAPSSVAERLGIAVNLLYRWKATLVEESGVVAPVLPIIPEILEADRKAPKKQRHTAKRIFERLKEEHGFTGGKTVVEDAVRAWRQTQQAVFLPLVHPPGEAQVDFGEATIRPAFAGWSLRTAVRSFGFAALDLRLRGSPLCGRGGRRRRNRPARPMRCHRHRQSLSKARFAGQQR